MSKKGTPNPKLPEIGSRAFAEDCGKVVKNAFEMLAEKYTGGDKEKLMEHFAIASVAQVKDDFQHPLLSRIEIGCCLVGTSGLAHKICAHIVHELSRRMAEDTGLPVEKCILKLTSDISGTVSMMYTREEAKNMPIGSIEADAMKKAFDSMGMDAIRKILGD